jgi:hypothetical protein
MITKDSSNVMCWVFWDAMIFCNNFTRRLKKDSKMITKDDSMRGDVFVFWDAMCWFSGMLCVGFLGCYDLL